MPKEETDSRISETIDELNNIIMRGRGFRTFLNFLIAISSIIIAWTAYTRIPLIVDEIRTQRDQRDAMKEQVEVMNGQVKAVQEQIGIMEEKLKLVRRNDTPATKHGSRRSGQVYVGHDTDAKQSAVRRINVGGGCTDGCLS